MEFDTVESAIEGIKQGKIVIVVDDEDRENEGDFIMAAEKATPEKINFMAQYGRGLVCAPLEKKRLQELQLEQMVGEEENTALMGCRFTVSVDTKRGTTTGISAHDRAATIKALVDLRTHPKNLARPGHIFPLQAEDGGVLKRVGHTEAAVDLARLAGLYPAGVLCEIMKEEGSMAKLVDLFNLKKRFGLRLITIADLVKYRHRTEKLIERVVTVNMPTKCGNFQLVNYLSRIDKKHHLALVKGSVAGKKNVLVRVHSECLTGEVFDSERCDCGEQVKNALSMIEKEGEGVFLYMRQEGRGMGLMNKMHAYALMDKGLDTVEANEKLGFKPDLRDYGIGAQILADLGLTTIRLITNNIRKVVGLEGYGLKIVERIPLQPTPNKNNRKYLQTKKEKLGHLIDM